MFLDLITNSNVKTRSQFFFGGGGGGAKPPKPPKPEPLPPPPVTYMPAPVPQSIPQASFVATAATPAPAAPANADTTGDAAVAEEAKRKMRPDTVGRQDTILTTGLGVTDPATTKKKTLLGGVS